MRSLLSMMGVGSSGPDNNPVRLSAQRWACRWKVWKWSPWPMAMNSTRSPSRASKMGASGATLLLIVIPFRHDRVLPVRQDVPWTSNDQCAVESSEHSTRAVVRAHGVVVVVPVTGAARSPGAVLGLVRGSTAPDVGPPFPRVVEGVVERAAVGLRVYSTPWGWMDNRWSVLFTNSISRVSPSHISRTGPGTVALPGSSP